MKSIITLAIALIGFSTVSFSQDAAPPADTSVSGTVFLDSDGDAALTEGDSGVSGVTVRLLDDDGNEVYTTTTGQDGTYVLVLEFDTPKIPFTKWLDKQDKIERFFGPNVRAELTEVDSNRVDVALVTVAQADPVETTA